MQIPRLEPPRLRIPTRRMSADQWLDFQILEARAQQAVYEDIELRTWPPSALDAVPKLVALRWSLNYVSGLEALRAVVQTAIRLVQPGGQVVAVARACNSGEELAHRMVSSDVPPDALGLSNLTNKEIACLAPSVAVFLSGVATKPVGADPEAWASEVRRSPVSPRILCTLPDRFHVKLLDVGLVWSRT